MHAIIQLGCLSLLVGAALAVALATCTLQVML